MCFNFTVEALYLICVRILPCFQEEMLVQEDPIELEEMTVWSKKKQAKKGAD